MVKSMNCILSASGVLEDFKHVNEKKNVRTFFDCHMENALKTKKVGAEKQVRRPLDNVVDQGQRGKIVAQCLVEAVEMERRGKF